MTMFVYLDEAGDTGFQFHRNSSRYFVVTLLLVTDPIPLHAAIDQLRRDLAIAPGNELKFRTSRDAVRRAFFAMLAHQDFTARALVIDKTRITRPTLRKRDTFYNELVRHVLTYDQGTISDATIILDESVTSRRFKKQFTSYLRGALNSASDLPKVRNVRYHASHTDNLIQATDMIAGAVYAAYHRRNSDYLDLIRFKVHIDETYL